MRSTTYETSKYVNHKYVTWKHSAQMECKNLVSIRSRGLGLFGLKKAKPKCKISTQIQYGNVWKISYLS
uniref:Uncharacterized protein n=1 Tax=Manihot esculenta TaxID=3983 RepID=A0A2C9W781_MANES